MLLFDAAEYAGHDPDRVSFVAALRILRRSIAQQGAFPPDHPDSIGRLWTHAIGELTRRLLPECGPARTRARSNASAQSGTSNEPGTATGHNRTAHPTKPWSSN